MFLCLILTLQVVFKNFWADCFVKWLFCLIWPVTLPIFFILVMRDITSLRHMETRPTNGAVSECITKLIDILLPFWVATLNTGAEPAVNEALRGPGLFNMSLPRTHRSFVDPVADLPPEVIVDLASSRRHPTVGFSGRSHLRNFDTYKRSKSVAEQPTGARVKCLDVPSVIPPPTIGLRPQVPMPDGGARPQFFSPKEEQEDRCSCLDDSTTDSFTLATRLPLPSSPSSQEF